MRAREILVEDTRTTIQKLEELIAHPSTEDSIRNVALAKLEKLRGSSPVEPLSSPSIKTNVSEEDMTLPYITGVSLGDIYRNLSQLSPCPCEVNFTRHGVIRILVPPPFMGKTKADYIAELQQACYRPRSIDGYMAGNQGYIFNINFL